MSVVVVQTTPAGQYPYGGATNPSPLSEQARGEVTPQSRPPSLHSSTIESPRVCLGPVFVSFFNGIESASFDVFYRYVRTEMM
jgi:hypothetical protein